MPSLIFTAGPFAGRRVEVTGQLVLGRDERSDIVVADAELSRRHAAVRPSGDAVEVEDLGSLNGTWVNGRRIGTSVVVLAPGDVVHLGTCEFELVEAHARAAETVAGTPPAPAPVAAPVAASAPAPAPPPARAAPARAGGLGAFVPPPPAAGGIATRRLTPTVLAFAVVVATAVALVLYFAAR